MKKNKLFIVVAIIALISMSVIIYAASNNFFITEKTPDINDKKYTDDSAGNSADDSSSDNIDAFESDNDTAKDNLSTQKAENQQRLLDLQNECKAKNSSIYEDYYNGFPDEVLNETELDELFNSLTTRYGETAVMSGLPTVEDMKTLPLADRALYLKLTENDLYYGSLINKVLEEEKLIDEELIKVSDNGAYINLERRIKAAKENPVSMFIANYADFTDKYDNSELEFLTEFFSNPVYTSKVETIQERLNTFVESDLKLLLEAIYIYYYFYQAFPVDGDVSDVSEISSFDKYRYAFFTMALMQYYNGYDWMGVYGAEDLSEIIIPASDINKIIDATFGLDGYNPEEISEYSKEKDAYIYEMPFGDGMGGDFGHQTVMNVKIQDDIISFTVGICHDSEYGNVALRNYSFRRTENGYRLISVVQFPQRVIN